MLDEDYMRHALALAKQGDFTAHPNPRVGCVLVRDHQIVGEGLHWQAGKAHAECHALAQAQDKARGATCYVTLEPCAHVGLTGPCVQALIQAQVKKVVIATLDPNPLVAGKGVKALEAANIEVQVGLLAAEAKALNKGFFSRMLRHRPYVRAKLGMSLDGRIAMASGESQWITCQQAREEAHTWRARSGAILTSRHTVQRDNCRLTMRNDHILKQLPAEIEFRQPLRVVVDTALQLNPQATIFAQPGHTLVMIGEKVSPSVQQAWLNKIANEKVTLGVLSQKDDHVDLSALFAYLNKYSINDVLVESGPQLTGALLQAGLIDEMLIYVAPKILGHEAMPLVALPGLEKLSDHISGDFAEVKRLGTDLSLIIQLSRFEEISNDNSYY